MKLILAALFMLGSLNVMATKGPFKTTDKDLLTKTAINLATYATIVGSSPGGKATVESLGSDGSMQKRSFRATFDTQVGSQTDVGAHGLGVTIPANAIITETYLYTVTQFADTAAGTVAYSCEDANNLKTAADVTGLTAGTITSTIDSASLVGNAVTSIAADCEITATIATTSQTAGKAILFGSYWVAE